MKAREGVLRGAKWRVGDGMNINIWRHKWLPSERGGGVLSPQLDPPLQVVSDLFLPSSKNWNEVLIDHNFYPWEAELIKSIPVS